MSRLLALCALNLLGAAAFAQSLPQNSPSAIKGYILRADTGAPIASAVVTLMPDAEDMPIGERRTRTSEDGSFALTGVIPGDYNLRAEKNGYLRAEYDDADQDGEGESLTVNSGVNLTDIDLRLRRSSVISGTVTDETGDPVQGVRVIAIRPHYLQRGTRTYQVPISTYTNDLGQYRLADLEPGEYYVGAGSGNEADELHRLPDSAKYTGIFYPAAEKIGDAQRIEVSAGTEISGISLAVRTELNSYTIRGAITGVGPGEFQNISVTVWKESVAGVRTYGDPTTFVNVKKDGSFSLSSAPPGNYEIEARHFKRSSTNASGQQSMQVGRATVQVTDADVNVHVEIPPPSVMRVKAHLQNGDTPARNLGLLLLPAGAAFSGNYSVCCRTFDAEGGLTLEDVMPGSYYFSLTGPFSAASYIERVACNGADYSEQPVIVAPGDSEFECEMIIGTDSAELTGSIMSDKEPARGYTVVAISESQVLRHLPGRVIGSPSPSNKEGHFLIPPLRPGDYLVFAVMDDPQQRYFALDFAERNSESAVKITIRPGESQNITIHPTIPR